jgi:hypothetical protein
MAVRPAGRRGRSAAVPLLCCQLWAMLLAVWRNQRWRQQVTDSATRVQAWLGDQGRSALATHVLRAVDRRGWRVAAGSSLTCALVLVVASSSPVRPAPAPGPPAEVLAAAPIPAAPPELPTPRVLQVANTDGQGLSLRHAPGTADRIRLWAEGTELVDLGGEQEAGGRSWRKVRGGDGREGWVAAEFLAERPALTSIAAAPTAPTAAGDPSAFVSGGLGLARADWERAHGEPSRLGFLAHYEDGRLGVLFLDGNVWRLRRSWGEDDAVTLETPATRAGSSCRPTRARSGRTR